MIKLEEYNKIESYFSHEVNIRLDKKPFTLQVGVAADLSTAVSYHGENKKVKDFFFFTDLYHFHEADQIQNILEAMNDYMRERFGLKGVLIPGSLVTNKDFKYNHIIGKFDHVVHEHSLLLFYDFTYEDLIQMEEFEKAKERVKNVEACQKPIKRFRL